MKSKDYLKLLLLFSILLMTEVLMARAGGGGGHGGGGHGGSAGGHGYGGHGHGYGGGNNIWGSIIMIGIIVFGSFASIITAIIMWKSRVSQKVIDQIDNSDPIWNLDNLKLNARGIFYKMQDAWENRDVERVKDILTPELYRNYKIVLDEMKERGEKNLLSSIDIKETDIVGVEDYKDDTRDRYVAYIKGTILDYTIIEATGQVIKNPGMTLENFTDTYHFIRVGDQWCLEKINNSLGLWHVLIAKNYKE